MHLQVVHEEGSFKRVNFQNRQSSVQRFGQLEFLVQNGKEHVSADCDPDLSLHRGGRSAEEVFDAHVLFDPAEEPSKAKQTAAGGPEVGAQRHQQCDLPAVLVKRGDGRGRHPEMIGEKDQLVARVGIDKANAS